MGSHIGLRVVVVAVALAAFACSRTQDVPQVAAPHSFPDTVVTARVTTLGEARSLRQSATRDEYLDALQSLSSSADLETRRAANALYGLELHKDKRWSESAQALRAAAAEYPEVAPFLMLRVAGAEEAQGNFAAAETALREVTASPSSAATVARVRLPAVFAALGDAAAADAALRETAGIAIDELTEQDFVDLASNLARRGRGDLATRVRMRLLTDYTSGRFTESTYGQLGGELDALSQSDAIALASRLARANRYDQALDLMERLAKRFPETTSNELYRSVRMRALFSSRKYDTLLDETRDVAITDPELMLVRARAAWRAAKPAEFLAGLAAIEKAAPKSRWAAEAKIIRAKYYTTDEMNYARAVADLEEGIRLGAVGNDGENLWTVGWTHTLAKKYDEALKVFDRYVRTYPDGDYKTNSLFWSAKIFDSQGRTAERDARARQLIAEFPFSYYAYRLKELWPALASTSATATAESVRPFPDVEGAIAQLNEPRLATVAELTEIELHRDAAREAKALERVYPDNIGVAFLLADVYSRGGEPFRANGVLQRRFRTFVRHGGANVPPRFWSILFPLEYWPAIQAEAAKRGVDPYLVASITRQESGFEPMTVSNAGAVGLMQIMPEEAARIGEAAGIAGVTRETLFDPATNIAVGIAEYQQKLRTMQSNPILAIAAYNAGERAVGGWLEKTPIEDIDLFIESIPFAETRLYVKTVTRNRFEYRRIYEQSAAAAPQQPPTQ